MVHLELFRFCIILWWRFKIVFFWLFSFECIFVKFLSPLSAWYRTLWSDSWSKWFLGRTVKVSRTILRFRQSIDKAAWLIILFVLLRVSLFINYSGCGCSLYFWNVWTSGLSRGHISRRWLGFRLSLARELLGLHWKLGFECALW